MALFLIVLLGGCHSSRIKFPVHGDSGPTFEVELDKSLSNERRRVIKECHDWLGTPYHYAHADKGQGTDCSGMVLGVYLIATEIKLPRNSAKQAEFCKKINQNKVKPGDLVFFATGKDPHRVSHVGIMIDSDRFIHASSSKGVCISSMSSNYYRQRFILYGRVPGMQ